MPFSPADLFTGADGAWWDFSDLSTLWQDATRSTTPVTAVGQPVRGVTDKSGNARHLAFAGGTAPTYQTDANGNGYLAFAAGVLSAATISGSFHTVGIANQHTGADTSGMVYDFTSASLDRAGFRDDAAGTSFGWYNGSFHTTAAAPSAAVKVLLGTLDKTAVATTMRENAADQSGTLNLSTNTNLGVFLGAREPSAAAPFNGNVYQVVHLARALTTTERSNLESYLAAKSGVTLPSSGDTGTGSGTLALTGTATAKAKLKASAAGTVGLSGAAAAAAHVKTAAAGALALSGGSAAKVRVRVAASGSLALTGTATDTVGSTAIRASAAGSIGFTGAATAKARVQAAANDNLALTGLATARVGAAAAVTPPQRIYRVTRGTRTGKVTRSARR